jgi:hypothetical protein
MPRRNNYLNYNLFNQLVGQESNYDKKVAAEQKNLEYAQQLEDRANKRVEDQMLNQDKVAAYMEEVDNKIGSLLPTDEAKIKELEKQKRQMVIDGVANSQGDYKQFLLQGGAKTLREYKKSVMDSEEVVNGLYNKGVYDEINKALTDEQELKDISVQIKDGKGGYTQEVVDYNTMMELYKQGKVDKLGFNGGQKLVDIKPHTFAKTPNPNNGGKYAGFVTVEEVVSHMEMSGQSPEIARRHVAKLPKFIKDGVEYTQFKWGVKEQTWKGLNSAWNSNNKTKAGKKKYGDAIMNITTAEPTGITRTATWYDDKMNNKTPVSLNEMQLDKKTMDAIYDTAGLIQKQDGSRLGTAENTVGFMNLDNGQFHEFKASDYHITGVSNKVEIVRDQKTGEVQMFAPATIMVSEEYMEDYLDEGSWWNGWTSTSKTWGGVSEDKDVNGNDMRELEISIPIPIDDPSVRERLNIAIGWEQGQTTGGVVQEDYVGQFQQRPEGTVAVPQPSSYQQINGQIYGNNAQFGGGMGAADVYKKSFVDAQAKINSSSRFSMLSQADKDAMAHQYAQEEANKVQNQ